MARIKVFGDSISGNCLKVKWTLDRLGMAYDWIETGVLNGETRTEAFLALNPAGQVPLAVLANGRPLAQSNAIVVHMAEGTDLIPTHAYDRAKMFEWSVLGAVQPRALCGRGAVPGSLSGPRGV